MKVFSAPRVAVVPNPDEFDKDLQPFVVFDRDNPEHSKFGEPHWVDSQALHSYNKAMMEASACLMELLNSMEQY